MSLAKVVLCLMALLTAGCIKPLPPTATQPTPAVAKEAQQITAITWQEQASMPTPRAELTAGVHAGKIYVPGGWTNAFGQSTALEVYDPQSDQWSALADLPVHLNHHVTVALDQTLYVIGIEGAFAYAIAANQWATISPPPDLRWAAAGVTIDGALYLVGGDSLNQDLLRYYPAQERWESLAPLPEPREHLAAATVNGQLYVIGGRWGEVATTRVDRYDPATDQWSPVASLNEARSGFGAVVVDNQIVVAGGETITPLRDLSSVEVYDPVQDQWTLLPTPLPFGVHGHTLVAVDDTLYLIGGSNRAGDVANTRKTLAGVLER